MNISNNIEPNIETQRSVIMKYISITLLFIILLVPMSSIAHAGQPIEPEFRGVFYGPLPFEIEANKFVTNIAYNNGKWAEKLYIKNKGMEVQNWVQETLFQLEKGKNRAMCLDIAESLAAPNVAMTNFDYQVVHDEFIIYVYYRFNVVVWND